MTRKHFEALAKALKENKPKPTDKDERIKAMRRVTFGIGQGLDKNGKAIGYELPKLKETALFMIASMFGGYHAQDGRGGWIDPRGKLVTEASLAITVFTDKSDEAIYAAAKVLAIIFDQESVLLAIEPVTTLVYISQGAENRPVESPLSKGLSNS